MFCLRTRPIRGDVALPAHANYLMCPTGPRASLGIEPVVLWMWDVLRGVLETADYNYTHTFGSIKPHTHTPTHTPRQPWRREASAQIKGNRPACAAAAQKGVKSGARRQERDERKRERDGGIEVLSSVSPPPPSSVPRSLDGSTLLYPQCQGPLR